MSVEDGKNERTSRDLHNTRAQHIKDEKERFKVNGTRWMALQI
jgi:hypothetical protein